MTNRKRWAACASTLLVLGMLPLAGPASAGGLPREHDGFFLRLSLGAGSGKAHIEEAGNKAEMRGGTAEISVALGGMVSKNLAIHGTLWSWGATDPEGDLTIVGLASGSGTFNGFLGMKAIGAGVTYYVMPSNIYLSGSIGSGLIQKFDVLEGSSNRGLALETTIGKEWWVAANWGLGVAGDFTYLSAKDKSIVGSNENWSVTGFGLRFSATFN